MSSKSLTTVCVLLAIIKMGVGSQEAIMTWHISSTKGNETLKFTQAKFEELSVCLCTISSKTCTFYVNQTTGFMTYLNVVPLDQDYDLYPKTYICEQADISALAVSCTRLEVSSCSNATSCWTYNKLFNNEPCALGPVKITWNSSQQFQRSFDHTKLTISSCNLTCQSIPASQDTTPLLPQPSEDTTKFSTSTTTATNHTASGLSQDDDNNIGTIIGVVVAVLVCAALIAVGVIFWWRRNKIRKADKHKGHQPPTLEMVNGGYNGTNGHSSSLGGNTSYVNVPAGHTKHNGRNPGYYNLRNGEAHMGNTSSSDYETTDDVASPEASRGDHGNVRRPGQGVDGYEEPVTARIGQAESQRYSNIHGKQSGSNNLAYDDVDDLVSASLQDTHRVNASNLPKKRNGRDDLGYEEIDGSFNADPQTNHSNDQQKAPGIQREGLSPDSKKHGAADATYAVVNRPKSKLENVYSEVGENDITSKNDHDDIVPPTRHRFSDMPSQSTVYELAKPVNKDTGPNSGHGQTSGPYAKLHDHSSTPVNPYDCVGASGADAHVYDSGSQTYFELESKDSIRVNDADSQEDPAYSSAEPNEYPLGGSDENANDDPDYYKL